MVSRMRYINRWSLMRNTRTENIEEHSLQVAVVAHAIAVIRKEIFPKDANGLPRISVDPNFVAALAIYHDTDEILTGDMPTPVKYFNPAIQQAYKDVEKEAVKKLLEMLPEELVPTYRELLAPGKEDPGVAQSVKIVKAADRISALIKCIEEAKAGNKEFLSAEKSIRASIEKTVRDSDLPEVKYYMERFVPAYSKTLDELESTDE